MKEEERFEYAVLKKRIKLLDAKPERESDDLIDWNQHLSLNDVSDLASVIQTLRNVQSFIDG